MLGGSGSKAEKNKPGTWRLASSLLDYIKDRAGQAYGAESKLVSDAVAMQKAFYEKLGEQKLRLQRYALDEQLDFSEQENEVYLRLILRGLEDAEKHRRK